MYECLHTPGRLAPESIHPIFAMFGLTILFPILCQPYSSSELIPCKTSARPASIGPNPAKGDPLILPPNAEPLVIVRYFSPEETQILE